MTHNTSINDSAGSGYDLFHKEYRKFLWKQYYAEPVFIWILSVIEIPVMILTLIALCFIVKSRPTASVFVSHLILSDLIQVITMLIGTATSWSQKLTSAHVYSLIAGLYFMACVSFERYLLVSHPIWYKSHQSLKLSCFISVIIWCVPLTFAEIYPPRVTFKPLHRNIAFLIPFPIIVLCFVGTWRGLSRSISLTALKRKLILGSLLLVLLTYTFLILPFLILEFIGHYIGIYNYIKHSLFYKSYFFADLLLYVNPLTDCILYLFIRPDVCDLMKSVHGCSCCRHQKHNQDKHFRIHKTAALL